MTRVPPLLARLVALIWLMAGLLLAGAGVIAIAMGGSLVRWELVIALTLGAVGLLLWRQDIAVDAQGVEQRRAGQRTRLMWSAVARVEVPVGRALAGPVRVWQHDRDQPVALPGSWGMTRSQGLRLVQAIRSVTARYDIEVDGPDGTADASDDAGAEEGDVSLA